MSRSRLFLDTRPLRRFPQFRRLWIGFGISSVRSATHRHHRRLPSFSLTHSNLDVGLISLAQVVPGLITPIFGGAIADRMDRRKLLVITAVFIAMSTAGSAINSHRDITQPCGSSTSASALTWALNGVDTPTRNAASDHLGRPRLLHRRDGDATVLRSGIFRWRDRRSLVSSSPSSRTTWTSSTGLTSPPPASALYFILRLAPLPRTSTTKFGIKSVVEGFQFLKGRRVIQACFITDINATLLGLPTSLLSLHGGRALSWRTVDLRSPHRLPPGSAQSPVASSVAGPRGCATPVVRCCWPW